MGRTADYSNQRCSAAATLEVIGDPWTLLIVREAFFGVRRFEQWQASLGVARNVLAARLRTLTAQGVFERRTYQEKPLRQEYVLTAKGRDLFPILTAMLAYGDKHLYGADREPVVYTHKDCGHRFEARSVCACCGEGAGIRDLNWTHRADALTVAEVVAEGAD